MLVPYLYLSGAALGVGLMAILRRLYQNRIGSDLAATLFFSALSSLAAFLMGLGIHGPFDFEPISFLLAVAYAFLSSATGIMCIMAAKYGSAASAILYGAMGTLVLPSCFGLVFDPTDSLSFPKALGFLFAFSALLVGFAKQKDHCTASGQGKRLQIAIFFTNGMALVVFKLMSMLRPGFSQGAFITEYMLISAVASAAMFVACLKRSKKTTVSPSLKRITAPSALVISTVYAGAFFLSDSFSMKCTALIPLTIQAPLSFCLPILCTAALEYIVYRQKLYKFDYIQLCFALACSICFVLG